VDTRLLKALAARALELAGAAANYNLSIVLVDDRQIATLNARFHHVQSPTDVLSFDYGPSEGELVISLERVRAQAHRFRTTPARELALYVSHGILHLHGYNDHSPRERRRMRAAERRLMNHLDRDREMQGLTAQ
jgi:probable rRNA maturation factor